MISNNTIGPFLRTQDAAKYCAYNYDRFRLLARKHQIPRHGPSHTRFSTSDLDRWMANPDCFIEKQMKSKPSAKRKVKLIA
jgi:hypothetical protein